MIVEGKTVVVSGVGPGLGREVAALVLRDGGNVVIGARTESKLADMAAELDPSGERVAHHRLDITDRDTCDAIMATAAERFGRVDAVVNVAALDTLFGGITDAAVDDWRLSFDTNVVGTVNLVQAAVPHLETAGGGAIVLIGSQSALLPQVSQIAYAAAKGALMSSLLYMAKELGPRRIRVNTVIPTWMWGPPVQGYVSMTAQDQGVPEEQVIAGITANMPLGEIPADEDVAECVVFLCSDRARMITGQSILVNAGELMR